MKKVAEKLSDYNIFFKKTETAIDYSVFNCFFKYNTLVV